MSVPKRITAQWLVEHDACEKQVALFRETFPRGTAVTPQTLRKAGAAGLEISWLVNRLPAPARKAYDEAITPARKAYDESIAPAQKAYDEAVATALAAAWDAALAGGGEEKKS